MTSMRYDDLPVGDSPAPVATPHFPSALYAAVFRNWDLVPLNHLARVLRATEAQIAGLAESMCLPPQREIAADEIERSYATLLRRNWHLMSYDQLGELLRWDAAHFDYALREDDGLFCKLGFVKPRCARLSYAPPTELEKARAAEIRSTLREELGERLTVRAEPPFEFMRQMQARSAAPTPAKKDDARFSLRMIYPYFLRYGDPLSGSNVDEDVTDEYLAQMSARGVNAMWFQGVLNTLAPWELAPELSSGWEKRLENLKKLCHRAERFGIQILMYLNEPRPMDEEFFRKHPELRGVNAKKDGPGLPMGIALCTSTPGVRKFLTDSVKHVFDNVPELAGVFTITFSENLTNCYSRRYDDAEACPRCKAKGAPEVIADVNRLIGEAMWSSKPDAQLLVWDWVWPEDWVESIVERLPKNAWLMRVSEWGKPFTRGDHSDRVGEYSISTVGPSEISKERWALARRHGLRTAAKIQATATWELGSLPYVPALSLVAEHAKGLCEAGVDGLMLSWTVGGYPSPNLNLISKFFDHSRTPSAEQAMQDTAMDLFGDAVAAEVVEVWKQFGAAFAEYPFHLEVVYFSPIHWGAANLLWANSTGYKATMTGMPYDDLDKWRGPYSRETLASQFQKVATGWKSGLDRLRAVAQRHPSAALAEHLRVAQAVWIHFQSTVNQIRFIMLRKNDRRACLSILSDEIELARQMHDLVAQDSRLGFEATNHYFYIRFDLMEKILNCRNMIDHFEAS